MHTCHMVVDFQFGSTGKGALAGWMAKRNDYDTAVCSFATNAGHTYIDKSRGIHMMTQQLPTAISSPTVKNVMLGPGALICVDTLLAELERYKGMMEGKRLIIHPHAAIVTEEHAELERTTGMSKIGSTTKGVGEAMIQRIRRRPGKLNVAVHESRLDEWVIHQHEYARAIARAESIIIEGAQGFSLSMYHGFYPYTTSRDVTPWQIAADCGLPFKWAPYIKVFGTLRTFPIRVNDRDGTSGPGYIDQSEIQWKDIGIEPELTTVTKLPRRIFEFSREQLEHAVFHCGGYWDSTLFLNFANYMDLDQVRALVKRIETATPGMLNYPTVRYIGFGPDDADIRTRDEFDSAITDSEGGELS